MELKIEHLTPYLPHRLKCQYTGILNGSEIRVWEKRNRQFDPFESFDLERPTEVFGEKTGTMRKITVWNSHAIVHVGNRWNKTFYEKSLHFKPILRPLSQLTEIIFHDGNRFVPTEWFEIGDENSDSVDYGKFNINLIKNLEAISDHNVHYDIQFLPYGAVQKLFEWHFDVFELIEKGLAIEKPSKP